MTTETNCKICRMPGRRRLIEADWAAGMSAVGIAANMTDSGWAITSGTVIKHLKEHAGPEAAIRVPPTLKKRDAAVFFRERIMDRIEELETGDGPKQMIAVRGPEGIEYVEKDFDILDKDLQPAINTALKAETQIEAREARKDAKQIGLLVLMLGGAGSDGLAPEELSDGMVIDGEATEVE